jgi:hypothetical protein
MVTFYADLLDDAEAHRLRVTNQMRALVTDPDGSNGFGKGISLPPLEEAKLDRLLATVESQERLAVGLLQRALRELPVGEFVTSTVGLGEKTVGRLLGLIGDPAWHSAEGRARSLRELWAYCGLHVVDGRAPRRRKGQKANWSTKARTRLFVIAEGCVKQKRSPYRAVYDRGREVYADRTHTAVCRNTQRPPGGNGCGTSLHPEWGEPGSPWRPGHQHAAAMRLIMKEVLRDLWLVSQGEQPRYGTPPSVSAIAIPVPAGCRIS